MRFFSIAVIVSVSILVLVAASCLSPTPPILNSHSSGEYVGSTACAACHRELYNGWRKTIHPFMERPAGESSVIGDFNGVIHRSGPFTSRMSKENGVYVIRTVDRDGEYRDFRVERTIGNLYKQRYVVRSEDGGLFVPPLEWNIAKGTWQDYQSPAKNPPGSAAFWAAPENGWETRCAGCHVTGLSLRPGPGGRVTATYAELGIGCESCHGPGKDHIERPTNKESMPRLRSLDNARMSMVCGQCHSRGHAVNNPTKDIRLDFPYGYRPGDDLDRFFIAAKPSPGRQAPSFWPDGSSVKHHQQYLDFTGGPHFKEAKLACVECHESHDRKRYAMLRRDPRNALCVVCHGKMADRQNLERHTRHGAESRGSICIECHMPKIVHNASDNQLHSHVFSNPDPAKAEEYAMPNACNLCHDDRPASWAREAMEKWKTRGE